DRGHRDHQRDQDVRGEPTAAAEVLALVVVVAAGGRVGLLTGCAEDVFRVGVPEVGHGPVPLVEGWWPAPTRCAAVRSDAGRPLNRDGPGQLLSAWTTRHPGDTRVGRHLGGPPVGCSVVA